MTPPSLGRIGTGRLMGAWDPMPTIASRKTARYGAAAMVKSGRPGSVQFCRSPKCEGLTRIERSVASVGPRSARLLRTGRADPGAADVQAFLPKILRSNPSPLRSFNDVRYLSL